MHLFSQVTSRRCVPPKLVDREGKRYRIQKGGDAWGKKMKKISTVTMMKAAT